MRELYDEDHAAFAASFRAFVERDAGEPDAIARAGKAGLLGMQVAEEHGGGGIEDPRFCAVAVEELVSAGRIGLALDYAAQVGVGQSVLGNHGGAQLCERWLPALAAGDAGIAVTDDPVTAEVVGDGIVLTGGSGSVVNGTRAAVGLVPYRTGNDAIGVAAVPLTDGVRRTEVHGLGVADAGLADLKFDGVRLARSHLLATSAYPALVASMRLWAGLVGVTGARTAMDWTRSYVQARKVFGRPVASFENTRQMFGHLAAQIRSAQGFTDRCLLRHQSGDLQTSDAAALKLVGTGLFTQATDEGLQLHGGYGYMTEYPISTLFADARFLRWYAGADEHLCLELDDASGR